MLLSGFEESFLKNHPRYKKESGYLTALVEPVCGMWGFTIWQHSTCVTGAKDWNWGRDEALERAGRALEQAARVVEPT